jgi:hypothetical protein
LNQGILNAELSSSTNRQASAEMEAISQETVLGSGFVRTPGCTLRRLNNALDDRWPRDEDSALYWYLFKPVAVLSTAAANLDEGVWATGAMGAILGSGGSSHVRLPVKKGLRREHAQIHFKGTSYYIRDLQQTTGDATVHHSSKFSSKVHSTNEADVRTNHVGGTYINIDANGIRPDYVLETGDVFYVDGHQFQVTKVTPVVPRLEDNQELTNPILHEESETKVEAIDNESDNPSDRVSNASNTLTSNQNEADRSPSAPSSSRSSRLKVKTNACRVRFGPVVTARVLPPRPGKRDSPRRRARQSKAKSNREEKVNDVQLVGSTAGSEQQSYVSENPDEAPIDSPNKEGSGGSAQGSTPAAAPDSDPNDPKPEAIKAPVEGALDQEVIVQQDLSVRDAQHLPDDEHFAALSVKLTNMGTGEHYDVVLGSRINDDTGIDVQIAPFTFGSSRDCSVVLTPNASLRPAGSAPAEVTACLDAWDGHLRLVDIGSSFNTYYAAQHDAREGRNDSKQQSPSQRHQQTLSSTNEAAAGTNAAAAPAEAVGDLVPWQVGTNVRVMRDCEIGVGDVIYVSTLAFQVGDVMLEGPTAEVALRIRKAQGKGLDEMAAQAIRRIATMGLQVCMYAFMFMYVYVCAHNPRVVLICTSDPAKRMANRSLGIYYHGQTRCPRILQQYLILSSLAATRCACGTLCHQVLPAKTL